MTAERILMGLLLAALGVACLMVLAPFLPALLWAAILVFTTWPLFVALCGRARLPRRVAALVLVAATALVVVVPLALAVPSAAEIRAIERELNDAIAGGLPPAPAWLAAVPLVGAGITRVWNAGAADLSALQAYLHPYLGILARFGITVLLGLASGVMVFGLSLFIAFFLYVSGERIADRLHALASRIAGPRAEHLITVTGATVRGAVLGIIGTALVQGLLTGLGLWLFGVPRPALLGVVAGGLAILPVGPPFVWVPASLWLMQQGHPLAGLMLLVYGFVAIGGADTLIRPYFIARGTQLPYLLTLLGVLGGLLAFGLLGVFLGPALLGLGYAMVNEWAPEH